MSGLALFFDSLTKEQRQAMEGALQKLKRNGFIIETDEFRIAVWNKDRTSLYIRGDFDKGGQAVGMLAGYAYAVEGWGLKG